jgi:hypothetical protein
MFDMAGDRPPTPVQDANGKWSLLAAPTVKQTGPGGTYKATDEDLDRWLGGPCPVTDDQHAANLAERAANPKPPINLAAGAGSEN